MKNYYCLLTRGYEAEECYTANEPFEKIEAYLKSYNLPYQQVFNKCDGKMQVIVYQYSTLYFKSHKQPKNLSIVISSLIINEPFKLEFLPDYLTNVKIFTVYSKPFAKGNNVAINCGKNRCVDCRRCYTKNKNPIYVSEILK